VLVCQVLLAMVGSLGPVASQAGDDLTVRTVRLYRGDRTLVNGFVRVPHAALDPVSLRNGGYAAFELAVEVRDSAGALLRRDAWSRRVEWAATRIPGTSTMEMLTFALAPGAYDVRVTLTDSASGRRLGARVAVAAYDARPHVSDLLLAERIRAAAGADTLPGAGEIRKGGLLLAPAPDLVLRPSAATLYVYGEAYRDAPDTVAWHLDVVGEDGRVLASTAPSATPVDAGGGVITGALDLTGRYTLRAVVADGERTTSRTAAFTMGGLELERRVVQASRELEVPVDTFARVSDEELDGLFEPLVHLPDAGDLGVYRGLSAEGKRRFLRAFWNQRDLTPGTPGNEAMQGFYARITEANRRFAEGGAGAVPGWRTDRGRVFVRYGEPDEILHRPSTGSAPPWEAWKYSRDRPRKYVFLDETRLGHFALIFSDDRQERSAPNWEAVIGLEATEEIKRF
jgi:GWxTD domain-containing protein